MIVNLHDFIAGCVGGVAGLIIGHPGETIKVRQQTYNTSMLVAIKKTYVHEGFAGFYKGLISSLVGIAPANALFFGTYGNCLQYMQNINETKVKRDDPLWKEKVFLAGCAGGFVIVIATCPLELVKTVLQANTEGKGDWKREFSVRETTMWACVKNIYGKEGVPGLYRGLVPMLYRDVPSYGLYTAAYEVLHQNFPQGCQLMIFGDLLKQIFSGGIAGILSWIFVMPFDLVKSRMQADNPDKPVYRGMLDCFYKSYKYDGIRVFNKGILVTVCRAFPVNAGIFASYEASLKVLQEFF